MGGPSHNDSLDHLLTLEAQRDMGKGVGGGEDAVAVSPFGGASFQAEPSASSRRRFRSGGARKHGATYKVS